jgi:multiple sugar transport system permease protein
MSTRRLENIATHTLLIILALLFLFPFYILIHNALMTDPQMTGFDWIWFPSEPQWRNFVDLFADPLVPMANSFRNSALIAISLATCEILVAIMAGYALARIPHPSRNLIFGLLLSTLLIPGTGTLIPKYVMVAKMGMVNTPQGLVVPQMFSVFSAFMFRQYFLSFPRDLEDAGHVDGLGYWGVFWRIAFPNAWPVIIALGSLALINGWNDFLWPLLIGQKRTWWTVQISLSAYITAQVVVLRLAFAGALLGALPMLIIFLVLQRHIAQGYTRTGIKG